ncbi:LLM class flavin-dependent oxidoreductase [Dactylosporangium sp. NPDC048998]|uniref:LLM class flavin-dependent oxidoreductase n=1 Tax=Dactylosporangium sp. NPDC048998 TaxID=3363976 RepID=UPI0037179CF0
MSDVRIFSTIPPASRSGGNYREEVRRAAQLSEAVGFVGALVYSDNNTIDPWVVAQEVLCATERFKPLVALQPVYMHPYAVAKKLASYGVLYGRGICLNLVAGGSRADLAALSDTTEHDHRYGRLAEYARLIGLLLDGAGPVTFDGEHYRVKGLALFPALAEHLRPELYISGSSEAGLQAARELGAVPVRYPEPPAADGSGMDPSLRGGGVRLGIVARDSDEDAWRVAHERFPATRAGRMLQKMARDATDSRWLAALSDADEFPGGPGSPYWMGPFQQYATFCPYLVGTYDKVADEVARYIAAGCRTFIMDTARADDDYEVNRAVFDLALSRVPAERLPAAG